MSRRAATALAVLSVVAVFAVARAPIAPTVTADEPKPSGPVPDPAVALEGGTPLPDGAWNITFPWMVKQSVSFVSDAPVERMIGAVNFSDPGTKPLGTVSLDGKGGGTGSFTVTLADVSTLSSERDEHLRSEMWLDAKKFPEVSYTITKIEKLKPTVVRVTGLWKMHGVEKEISALANVRFIEKMDHFEAPAGIARLKTRLSVSLKAFGVDNPYVGSPAVADAWDVEMVLIGVIAKP
jgi:polyisoprenoid-binding protein YceI